MTDNLIKDLYRISLAHGRRRDKSGKIPHEILDVEWHAINRARDHSLKALISACLNCTKEQEHSFAFVQVQLTQLTKIKI